MNDEHELLIQGPFAFCRNPKALGTILLYLSVGILVGSPLAVSLTFLFTAVLVTYIKIIEEKELEERFGADYEIYKQDTPFLIPRLRKAKV